MAATGQPASERMQAANEAFGALQYQAAIDGYEQLLQEGYTSEALFYNLGNAYFRRGDLGRAILNYERALLIDPHDADILHNLAVAQSRLPGDLEVIPGFFLTRWWRTLHQSAPAAVWAILGLVTLWLGAGGLIGWLFAPVRKQRKLGFFAGWGLLILSLLPFALAFSQAGYVKDTGQAVVIEESVTLRTGADATSSALASLPPGVKVQLLDVIGEWYKVRLQNGEEGWLPDDSLEKVQMTNYE